MFTESEAAIHAKKDRRNVRDGLSDQRIIRILVHLLWVAASLFFKPD